MMSGPEPDWIAAVIRACRSFALIVSRVTLTLFWALYSVKSRSARRRPPG
jgi:hypothetical protein